MLVAHAPKAMRLPRLPRVSVAARTQPDTATRHAACKCQAQAIVELREAATGDRERGVRDGAQSNEQTHNAYDHGDDSIAGRALNTLFGWLHRSERSSQSNALDAFHAGDWT